MPTRFHLRCATRFLAPKEQVQALTQPDGAWMPALRDATISDWKHERRCIQASDAVRYEDQITFTPKGGKLHAILVERLLQRHHRHLAKQLPAEKWATAVSTLRVALDVESDGQSGFM